MQQDPRVIAGVTFEAELCTKHAQRAMLTDTHPFCSKTVTFLPSPSARPAFRRINRREIAGLVGIADMPKFLKHPLADFGLAS
jgi:hypothetical protein